MSAHNGGERTRAGTDFSELEHIRQGPGAITNHTLTQPGNIAQRTRTPIFKGLSSPSADSPNFHILPADKS